MRCYSFIVVILILEMKFWNPLGTNLTVVTRCPKDKEEWTKRSEKFYCVGKKYHCLKSSNSSLLEVCASVVGFRAQYGCPVLELTKDSFKITQKVCSSTKYKCPDIESYGFILSNMLYQSFVSELFVPSTTTITPQGVRYTAIALISGGIFLAIFFTLLCTVVVFQCLRIRRLTLQSKYMSSVPYNPSTSHPYIEERIYDEVIESSSSAEADGYMEPQPSRRISQGMLEQESHTEHNICRNERRRRTASDFSPELDSLGSAEKRSTGTVSYVEPNPRESAGENSLGALSFVESIPLQRMRERATDNTNLRNLKPPESIGERGTHSTFCMKSKPRQSGRERRRTPPDSSNGSEVHDYTEFIDDSLSRQDVDLGKENTVDCQNVEEYDDVVGYMDESNMEMCIFSDVDCVDIV